MYGIFLEAPPRVFACGEDSIALPLTSELDAFRGENVNRIPCAMRCGNAAQSESGGSKRKKNGTPNGIPFSLEAPPGFEPGDRGFADLCLTAWPWRRVFAITLYNKDFDLSRGFWILF